MVGDYTKAGKCQARKVEVLGAMQLFRDQGWEMVQLSHCLREAGDVPGRQD